MATVKTASDDYQRTMSQLMGFAQSCTHEQRFDPLWTYLLQQYDTAVNTILARMPS